jgi:D-arabinose 1-dehydrogenase-like Zn-dependent alcohol dehydrogenase
LNTGYSIAGTHAEYAIGYAKHIVKVPDGVTPLDTAPLTCAGVTTSKAVKVSGARPSDLVAIFGIGGLGHLALQYVKVAGASVVAVDLFDEKLQLAKELGADYVVNAQTQDLWSSNRKPKTDWFAAPPRCDKPLRLPAPFKDRKKLKMGIIEQSLVRKDVR